MKFKLRTKHPLLRTESEGSYIVTNAPYKIKKDEEALNYKVTNLSDLVVGEFTYLKDAKLYIKDTINSQRKSTELFINLGLNLLTYLISRY